jgi:2-keto-3-deoxy-L-rhamnonate aldolase RhmA
MINKILQLLRAGQPAFGAQLRLGSPAIAEMFSLVGFDWLSIDSEHAPQSPEGIQLQLQAIAVGGANSIVRIPKNDPDLIRLYLDMGAAGVMVPFINTAADAEAGVRACRYPPRGTRGFGPARASKYGLDPSYFTQANDQIIFIPIIETAEAVNNIDAIFAVDGIETCMLGPADLSISLGHPLDLEHAAVQQAMDTVAKAGKRAGKASGNAVYGDWMTPQATQRQLDAGFKVLLLGGDEWMLSGGCTRLTKTLNDFRHPKRG